MRAHARLAVRRIVVVATAVMAVVVGLIPAAAQPAEPDDPMKRYQQLGTRAAAAEEDLAEAQRELARSRKERTDTVDDVATAAVMARRAAGAERRTRGQANKFAAATYRGASFSGVATLLSSDSKYDYLERAAIVDMLASQKNRALASRRATVDKAAAARTDAATARERADRAIKAAERAVTVIEARQATLDEQIQQVRQALDALPDAQRDELGEVQDNGSYEGPPGAANDALQAALSKRGSEYQWGAEGPNEFDCSGLTSWAYNQAGVSLPRTSREQFRVGRAVDRSELQPGDLVFYDDGSGDPGAIHHVGMYVGDGKMVDAPTEGQVVDVRSAEGDGHYIGARRIAG